jgi:hypothetical protein
MIREAQVFDPLVVEAIRRIRGAFFSLPFSYPGRSRFSDTSPMVFSDAADGRFLLAALTNTFSYPDGHPYSSSPKAIAFKEELKSHFHLFLESSVVGMRKPEDRFYQLCCSKLGVSPSEAVFLDDIGTNLKAAEALGMLTIQVRLGQSEDAILELERYLGMSLVDRADSKL